MKSEIAVTKLSSDAEDSYIEELFFECSSVLQTGEYSDTTLRKICAYCFYAYAKDTPLKISDVNRRKLVAFEKSDCISIFDYEDFIVLDIVDLVVSVMFTLFESERWTFYVANKEAYIDAINILRKPIVGEVSSEKYAAGIRAKKDAQELCVLSLNKDEEFKKIIQDDYGDISKVIEKKRDNIVKKNVIETYLDAIRNKSKKDDTIQ